MKISNSDAEKVAKKLGLNLKVIKLSIWKKGLEIELEHGNINKKTNVTDNDLIKTGKITLAHLLEFPDYYERLIKMEMKAEKFWENKEKSNILL